MGASASRMKRSDSAAFGRLRIDSPRILTPGPGSIKTSLQRRRQLRIAEYGATVVSNPSENSPFVKIPSGGFQSSGPLALKNVGSPPLQVWIAPALCCAMAYALYNIFIKKGSSHINPVLGGVILQLVAAVLGCGLLTFLLFTQGGSEVIVYDGEGIYWAILAGVAVGSAEITSFFVSSLGVQAMQSIPVIIGGSVLFGTVIGSLALHEELSVRGWCGVFMISLGISLVGLDSQGEGL